MTETNLDPESLKGLAVELRKRPPSRNQGEVAEMLGISQSNLSEAENNPASRAKTLVRVIESLSDFRFEQDPLYKTEHNPDRDLSGETFESLYYHMPLLFYLCHRQSCHLLDLQSQFPDYSSEGVQRYIETDSVEGREKVCLGVGMLNVGATGALQDLLDEGLAGIGEFEVYGRNDFRDLVARYRSNRSGTRPWDGFKNVHYHISNTPGAQGENCWYVNKSGDQISLEGKGVYVSFHPTENAQEIVEEKLGKVYSNMREDEK